MRKFYFLLVVFFTISCVKDKNEKIYRIQEDYQTEKKDEPIVLTKYIFVVIIVEKYETYRKRFITDVMEVTDEITEDYKYKELDLAERELIDNVLDGDYNVIIESRDFFVFSSYKDASIKRQEILRTYDHFSLQHR